MSDNNEFIKMKPLAYILCFLIMVAPLIFFIPNFVEMKLKFLFEFFNIFFCWCMVAFFIKLSNTTVIINLTINIRSVRVRAFSHKNNS